MSLDGTGYGDDGTIWGGEIFVGKHSRGLRARGAPAAGGACRRRCGGAASGAGRRRVSRPARRPARSRARRRSGSPRATQSRAGCSQAGTRVFPTTSAGPPVRRGGGAAGVHPPGDVRGPGRHVAGAARPRRRGRCEPYPFPFDGAELDWRPLLRAVVDDRLRGRDPARDRARVPRGAGARAARRGRGALRARTGSAPWSRRAASSRTRCCSTSWPACSRRERLELWINHVVPPNDGGISLGQAALGALGPCTSSR